jgi:hypothetical protein
MDWQMQARRSKGRKRKGRVVCTCPSAGLILLDRVYVCLAFINGGGSEPLGLGTLSNARKGVHWSRSFGHLSTCRIPESDMSHSVASK